MAMEMDVTPPGFKLRAKLLGYTESIKCVAWSPDGAMLASSSDDGSICFWDIKAEKKSHVLQVKEVESISWSPDGLTLAVGGASHLTLWDTKTGKLKITLSKYPSLINSVTWSPDGKFLAVGNDYNTIHIWNTSTGQLQQTLSGHVKFTNSVAWSPDGKFLASGSSDTTVRFWDSRSGACIESFSEHTNLVHSVAWSPDGKFLASASSDQTIRVWDPSSKRQTNILESHTNRVTCVSFSADGYLLASKSQDGTVRFWRTDTWECVKKLDELCSAKWSSGLAFHPHLPILATLGENDRIIRIWDLDLSNILGLPSITSPVYYANAKVVLVGDSGVGKSGLGLVLAQQKFVPTESTHGRSVWIFSSQETESDLGHKETREIFLWDLAGQPGYRLIHQLHLNEVAVALIVFDAHSETNPLAGIHYWNRALLQAQRLRGNSVSPMKKFLVMARIDREGRSVSSSRINALLQEMDFDHYFETSAKEGTNISELAEAIHEAIDWQSLPKVSSTNLFQDIKDFLISEKEANRLLSRIDDLFRTFLKQESELSETEELRAQFETCIGLVESRGFIRQLSFGSFVLLQPELIDIYAAALLNAVKDEPDGLGSIAEEKAQAGDFYIAEDKRLKDKEQEKLLLIAMVEDLLRHEIALREPSSDGIYLVFPAQSTRENPDLPDPEGKNVIFRFEGPVFNIYTTLAVRLSHSGLFKKQEIWKNAIIYTTKRSGAYGIYLQNRGEGYGELTVFFDKTSNEEMCLHFEEYIQAHLHRRALPGTIHRTRVFSCTKCGESITTSQVEHRRKLGYKMIRCNVCEETISLVDEFESFVSQETSHQSFVSAMDQTADKQRELGARASVHQGFQEMTSSSRFDVFLCYNKEDKVVVRKLAKQLRERGIIPWLDEWELRPGLPWQRVLEENIAHIKTAAVCVGRSGIGPWQQQETDALLREFVRRNCPVIPVLLKNAPDDPPIPLFLQGMTWVDFRDGDPDPIKHLIWGITGKNTNIL